MLKTSQLIVFSSLEAETRTLPVVCLRLATDRDMLDSVMEDGGVPVVLADCRGSEDLQKFDVTLSIVEARVGAHAGMTPIIASVDSAAGLMLLPSLGGKSARLVGLTWNRQAFCADIGCAADSAFVAHARMQVIIAARAFNLPAYDSLVADIETEVAIRQSAAFGFSGYMNLAG